MSEERSLGLEPLAEGGLTKTVGVIRGSYRLMTIERLATSLLKSQEPVGTTSCCRIASPIFHYAVAVRLHCRVLQ